MGSDGGMRGEWRLIQPARRGPAEAFANADEAERAAAELRGKGIAATAVHVSALCPAHPVALLHGACHRCGAAICPECALEAGAPECGACARTRARRERNRRLRVLFSIFLFAVFLFEVAEWRQGEEAQLRPPVRVGIIQLVPPELADHPRIAALQGPDAALGRALTDIEAYFDLEFRRYTNQPDNYVDVSLYGPFAHRVSPPSLTEPELPPWTLAWRAWQHPRYFHGLARAHGVEPEDLGARVYVVYTGVEGDVASDSRGSRTGRIGVAYISVDEPNLAYSVVTVAHELAHVLGAIDLYDPDTWLATWPEGYVEPFAEPVWPQRWAELMAVDLPLTPTHEAEVRSLFHTRIGYETAARLGWIGRAQADDYYAPDLDAPEAVLEALRQARDRASPVRSAAPVCEEEPGRSEPAAGD